MTARRPAFGEGKPDAAAARAEELDGGDHPAGDTGKPLRADARRNRARLLAVAEQVFSAKGMSASTEEIAKAAGVGTGTVFRHFPTKEALLEAVFVGRLSRLADRAHALCTAAEPGPAFFTFFTAVVDQATAKNAFVEALEESGVQVQPAGAQIRAEFRRAVGALLAKAQQAGAVRADIGTAELVALLVGASRAAEHVGGDPALKDRTVAIVLDGLRAAPVRGR